MKESAIIRDFRRRLDMHQTMTAPRDRVVAIKIHGGAYATVGLPDMLLLYRGRAAWIEFKVPGKVPTPIQKNWLRKLNETGCRAVVATSAGDALEFVKAWCYAIDRPFEEIGSPDEERK